MRFAVAAGGVAHGERAAARGGRGADSTGRLGDGTGRWQLLVTAGGAVEVMSLMQGPNGHLSNVSATPRGAAATTGLRIVAESADTVRPLQTIVLAVPGGLGNSDYTVLMDLSGTGAFPQADTIEVEGLTTDRNEILTASPMRQALAEATRRGDSRCGSGEKPMVRSATCSASRSRRSRFRPTCPGTRRCCWRRC